MRIVLIIMAAGVLAACGGSATAPSPGGNTPPVQTNTITITAQGGASPLHIVVNQGTRVVFINNDTRVHEMSSDAHPAHTDCPEINQVGLLNPGQQRETGNLTTVRTCGFHDHINPGIANLRGSITIR
ncbi:MAG: hypothetical protein O2917_03670 [Acidobacteria bacterium]|nr:hypothetical protein [Acidobacteriota bacterium]